MTHALPSFGMHLEIKTNLYTKIAKVIIY